MQGISFATVLAATAFATGAAAHAAKPGDGGLAPIDPRTWNTGKANGH